MDWDLTLDNYDHYNPWIDGDIQINRKIINCEQKNNGDCWLLSALICLYNCKKGKELFNNAIWENSDGSVSIYFKAIEHEYIIERNEIIKYKQSDVCPLGSDTIIAIELAIIKFFKDIYYQKIIINKNAPYFFLQRIDYRYNKINIAKYIYLLFFDFEKFKTYTNSSPLDGGLSEVVFFLLSGKIPETITNLYNILPYIHEYELNKETSVLTISFYSIEKTKAPFIFNKDFIFLLYHCYSIIDADNFNLTIVNPWEQNKKIYWTINLGDLAMYNVKLTYCNLSSESNEKKYIQYVN
ncbi:hypothetical protein IJ182_03955 [bacterium]|nr:hypothetical protein [bacterium]